VTVSPPVTVNMMTGVLIIGMLHRERHGLAKIGWESASILGLHVMSAVVLFA
jgi:cation:H+ antiporter